ncbi:MAG: D-alanine--D-alanine ligase [Pseudonocardia sp.]|nr:D-alanine--D-alanine ligase [Pseudonocardia sp.]
MMRVLHLAGSAVSEFFADLSRLYAADCLDVAAGRNTAVVAYVTPDRRWRFPADLTPAAIAAAPPLSIVDAVARIEQLRVDVVLPQMFCVPGMTTYRALFDALGIPYVGNPPDVMALGADKAKARAVVAAAGVHVPAGEVLRRGERCRMSPPIVVKPVDADNSLGVTLVRSPEETDAAMEEAFTHSDRVLVERYVELGREVRCGIVVRDGELVCLPLEEYAMGSSPVRRYADKIARTDDGELGLVAKDAARAWIVDPADPITEVVWDAARTCHEALGCRHYSLFDFRVDPGGRPWFLEAGLYCSFARKSVVVMMAEAGGMHAGELLTTALQQAVGRRTG